MKLLTELINVINAIGFVLLQIAIGLLSEELTFAGLTRLRIAPRQGTSKNKERTNGDTGENQ